MSAEPRSTAELTLRAVILGVVLSVVMGSANVYLGLKAGMTVSASIPAAVMAMLILRGLFRGGTILEANQVQTAASAGESLAAGIIFTMPALVLIGVWTEFDMVMTTAIAFTGGLLGILFMIPMRRVFVLGQSAELTYPEGVACAAVLQAGEDAPEGSDTGAGSVMRGALVGAVFKAATAFVGALKGQLAAATAMGPSLFYFGADISPALLGVGFIVRLNVAVLIFLGGSMAWLVGIPLLGGASDFASNPLAGAEELWASQIRYAGVGAMVVGGIATIWKVRGSLLDALRTVRRGAAVAAGQSVDPRDRDLPGRVIAALAILATGCVGVVYWSLTDDVTIAAVTTVIMLIMALFFTAVASYIVGLVGNSNSPVSGMTITAVLFTGALLLMFGFSGTEGMAATLGVAAIVCCAACTSGDVCNDLKTGHMVGASPRKQQIMQIIGVAAACFVMAPVMQLLHDFTPGGIGGKELAAPQATLFASLARGFFGDEPLPWDMVQWGAFVGVGILLVDRGLEIRGAKFRAHIMPIAVGMYLPFGLSVPILIGGLIAHGVTRPAVDAADADVRGRRGVLMASGIIAGEALMGVALALAASFGIQRLDLSWPDSLVTGLTLAAAGWVLLDFVRTSRKPLG